MVCEAFTCTPSEALEQPYGLTMGILGLRAYARAKETLDSAEDGELPESPMIDLVAENYSALIREQREKR